MKARTFNTRDLGMTIYDVLWTIRRVPKWVDDEPSAEAGSIVHIDASDPNNLQVLMRTGEKFVVRIIARD